MENAGPLQGHALAQAIVDTIREPLLVLDKDLRVVAASRSFYQTCGLLRQDIQGLPVYMLDNGRWNNAELRLLLERILPQKIDLEAYEIEYDSGRGRRTILFNARKIFSADSDQPLILLAMEDVTMARGAERALKDLLREKDMLLAEMQHRVVNSLQIIASILLLKARSVPSLETRLHLEDSHKRVMSIASIQEHLHANRSGEMIEIGPYLVRLCEALGTSMITEAHPISLKTNVEAGAASSRDAVSIGLIVTELVLNAIKHAFLSDKLTPEILVGYQVSGPAWRLTVSDKWQWQSPCDRWAINRRTWLQHCGGFVPATRDQDGGSQRLLRHARVCHIWRISISRARRRLSREEGQASSRPHWVKRPIMLPPSPAEDQIAPRPRRRGIKTTWSHHVIGTAKLWSAFTSHKSSDPSLDQPAIWKQWRY